MLKKTAAWIMLMLLLISTFLFISKIQPVKTATIIVPDDYSTIQQAVDAANDMDTVYVRQGTYNENITVPVPGYPVNHNTHIQIVGENRDSTIVNGSFEVRNAYNTIDSLTIIGDVWEHDGMGLTVTNSIVKGAVIGGLQWGSGWHVITGNTIYEGIQLGGDVRSIIAGNVIYGGIRLDQGYHIYPMDVRIEDNRLIGGGYEGAAVYLSPRSRGINVTGNTIENASIGVYEEHDVWLPPYQSFNNFVGNNISFCNIGISIQNPSEPGNQSDYPTSHSTVVQNLLYNNTCGIYDRLVDEISIYHNDFINNSDQILVDLHPIYNTNNTYDNGYPFGGNYWSDSTGVDVKRGYYQNETGSDGIGDSAYAIDANNTDRYPLMKPYAGPHDIGITALTTSRTVVGQGYSAKISLNIINCGVSPETFNVILYANTSSIAEFTFSSFAERNSLNFTFTWNTTGFVKGNYTISAYAWPVMGETDTADNNAVGGNVTVTIPGDVDGDFVVTILDVVKITSIYASRIGESAYKPNSDIDSDGVITILDVVICTSHYAEKWP